MQRRVARSVGLIVSFVAIAALLVAFPGPISRAFVAATIDAASGYRVAFGTLDLRNDRATARGVTLARAGEIVLLADRVELRYRLRDLLPGSEHRFGITHFELDRPRLTLVRHADGSFNVTSRVVPVPQAPVDAGATTLVPLHLSGALRDGEIVLVDRFRKLPESRRLSIGGLSGSVTLDNRARSSYHLRGRLANDAGQPLTLDGRFDAAAGYASHRLQGEALALVPLVNYFIDDAAARFDAGRARRADVRLYGFAPHPGDPIAYHLGGSLELVDGAMHLPGLVPSARAMAGRIDFFDGGLAAPSLAAKIGGIDVRGAGGLLDWQHLGFRLGFSAPRAALSETRKLFAFSRDLPLAGDARLETLLEGPVAAPLVATRVVAPGLSYGVFPVRALGVRAIYYASAVEIVGLHARYGGLDVAADGAIDVGPTARSQLVVGVAGPAARIPYLAQVAGGADVRGTALLAGRGLQLDARGTVDGGGAGTAIRGNFHLAAGRTGFVGPIEVAQAAGSSLTGSLYLDRSPSRSGFWLAAHDAAYADLPSVRLPGSDLTAPPFGGRLDGAIAGAGSPNDFRIAGRIGGRALRVGTVHLDDVRGDVVGRIGDTGLGNVAARGPWGAFAGQGGYVGARLALEGTYRGTFAQLATLTGNLGGRGPLVGPIALLIDPHRTIVQVRGATSPGARILGVPVDGLSGTLAVSGNRVRVYAATGAVAGGTLVAAGTLDGPGTLGISAGDVATVRLPGLVPLAGAGRVSAIGAYGVQDRAARFQGGLALGAGATFDRLPVEGNGDVTLRGNSVRFSATDARFGPAVGTLEGRLANLGTLAPSYDAHLHLLAAPLAGFVRAAFPGGNSIAGTLVGDVRMFGSGRAVSLAGNVGIPEGSVNGLAIRDASVALSVDSGGIAARSGRVTVGSTRAGFGAYFRGYDAAIRLDAPHANLADFNDYFDAGDTLGGRGRVAAHFVKTGATVRTSADIAIAGLTYRRFDLGDASARWNSQGSKVTGAVAFGGASGRLETAGTLGLATGAPLDKLLQRSRFDGTARLRGLDLGVWLPALGYQLPVLGRVNADATIAGPLRNPDVRTDASLRDGSVGAFPVDRLDVSATSTLRRTTVTHAQLNLPAIALVGSGSFGFGAHDPVALRIHARSPNVGTLAARLAKLGDGVSGSLEVDVNVGGTRARPRLAGGFDLEDAALHGVKVPRALGQFSANGRDVVLSSVEVAFAMGTLLLAGSVPLRVSPFALGPAAAPIALELSARGIDLANFAPLLPTGSKLSGKLDGRVAIGGTAGMPRLNGTLALGGGTLVAPFESYPLTDLGGKLSFTGNDAKLEALHASAGGGSLDATGSATFADFIRPGPDATYRIDAVAKRLRLNLPAYGNGQVDGMLSLAHRPGHRPVLGGKVTLADATIPFAALLIAEPGSGAAFGTAAAPPPRVAPANDVALDLTMSAASNVRVRSSNVDIGARGDLHVAGTAAAPTLDGGFDSTGGTLSYVNTVFRLVDGRVTFSPELGLIPTLDARAVTHVSNPDPNTVRNLAGTADLTLDVTGPVTNLAIALSSDPPYDRQQILGLLFSAPALGASNLFGETTGVPTLYGSSSPTGAPPGYLATRSSSGQFSVAAEAFGIANAQFTRTLLAPIETSFAQAVGLSNFNVNVDYTGAVGVTARKVLGKKIDAVYGTSFGYPYRQTFGFEIKPNDSTAAQVTVFQTLGATGLTSLTPPSYQGSNLKLQAAQPSSGTAGFSLSLQRLFK